MPADCNRGGPGSEARFVEAQRQVLRRYPLREFGTEENAAGMVAPAISLGR